MSDTSLRSRVMSGGFYLAMRQGLGMIISLGGMLLLTRLIGPEQYGLYAATFGIFWYFQTVCQLGIEIYLVRYEGEAPLQLYHQAFILLLFMACLGVGIAWLGIPLLQSWIRIPGFERVAQVVFLGLPIVLSGQVPAAKLERMLDYRRLAMIELANQIVFYLVALWFAFRGWGVWAPVAGWYVQQIQGAGLIFWASGYRPRWHWDPALIKQMLAYSLGFSASIWIWYARSLVNPLIVGRLAGAEAVGFIAIAIRLVEVLGFVKSATWRLAIATLSKLQHDSPRLLNAINEGMGLQILALAPLLVGFAWIAPWILPQLFGAQWIPVVMVFPFIALGNMTNALFNLHSSALYVLKHNWQVALFHLIHIGLFIGAALLFVPHYGVIGYGFAEIMALLSYIIIHYSLRQEVGTPDYGLPSIWWFAFALALFVHQFGWWLAIGIIAVLCLPLTHHRLGQYLHMIRSAN
jgi:O-antigen/teichoic acid export membrane protein